MAKTISTSPLPKKKDGKKLMSFSEIIMEVFSGKKITKLEWNSKEIYGMMKNDVLMLHKADGKDYHWILSKGDIEGNDWVVL